MKYIHKSIKANLYFEGLLVIGGDENNHILSDVELFRLDNLTLPNPNIPNLPEPRNSHTAGLYTLIKNCFIFISLNRNIGR